MNASGNTRYNYSIHFLPRASTVGKMLGIRRVFLSWGITLKANYRF
jgi:hypothetical protein